MLDLLPFLGVVKIFLELCIKISGVEVLSFISNVQKIVISHHSIQDSVADMECNLKDCHETL